MGTRDRRDREREQVRRRIMDAARDLFVRDGYEAVSMRRIADAIEYSPAAIYLHFKDKAELMRAICDADFASLFQRMRELGSIGDPVERIRQLGLLYVRIAVEHPNHFRLMFMTRPHPELMEKSPEEARQRGQGDPERDGYAFLRLSAQQAIKEGRFRPEFRDSHQAAQLFWAAVHGVAALHVTRVEADPWCPWRGTDSLARLMVDTVMRGVLADRPRKRGRR